MKLKVYFLLFLFSSSEIKAERSDLNSSVFVAIDKLINFIDRNHTYIDGSILFPLIMTKEYLKEVDEIGSQSTMKLTRMYVARLTKMISNAFSYQDRNMVEYDKSLQNNFLVLIARTNIFSRDIIFGSNYLKYDKLQVVNITLLNLDMRRDYVNLIEECIIKVLSVEPGTEANCTAMPHQCYEAFLQNHEAGNNYFAAMKLCIFMFAHAKKCVSSSVYKEGVSAICSSIYQELYTLETMNLLFKFFDLLLQDSVFCGQEGFVEFLFQNRLRLVLNSQNEKGCFPLYSPNRSDEAIYSNKISEYWGICNPHATGFGLAYLALHYNYLIKSGFQPNTKQLMKGSEN